MERSESQETSVHTQPGQNRDSKVLSLSTAVLLSVAPIVFDWDASHRPLRPQHIPGFLRLVFRRRQGLLGPTWCIPGESQRSARQSGAAALRQQVHRRPNPTGDDEGDYPRDVTDGFTVRTHWVAGYLNTHASLAREGEHHKWTPGVGIAVGLSVPLLMVVTALVTWMVVGESRRAYADKPIDKSTR
ncbi:hypothetical protein DL769_006652 [Monosporascus sp. CRB-8-3]|nr:hypothetical protein DL769_006652 [Monosporascus sp. CRB-8-3]